MGRIIACKSSELEAGKMKKVSVDSKEILVANVNGNYLHVKIHAHMLEQVYQKEV